MQSTVSLHSWLFRRLGNEDAFWRDRMGGIAGNGRASVRKLMDLCDKISRLVVVISRLSKTLTHSIHHIAVSAGAVHISSNKCMHLQLCI